MKKVGSQILFITLTALFTFAGWMVWAGTPPVLEVLSPTRGEEISFAQGLVIAISIYDPEGDVDLKSIELKVNGVDVTQSANVSGFLVTYPFEETTKAGRHTFTFSVKDREGNSSRIESYFTVSPEPVRERKISAHGSIKAGGEYDKEAPKNAIGSVELNMFGGLATNIDYSLNIGVTNEEGSDMQRLSTYRFDLRSPYGGLVLGDATPSFTDYSINGKQVFGVHLLPQFGFFGFELLYGQSLRPVESPDEPETFRQMVYGGKIKIGNERKVQWGLAFLKVKDDKESITTTTVTPKDNIVIGTDLKLSFLEGKITFRAEANESMLNDDITGGPAKFADYELPFDPEKWEWLFTINEHIVPVIPGLTSLGAKAAVKVGPFYNNTLNAEYSYVGAGYNSLGNTAVVKDRAGIRLWDSLWLMQNRVFINATFQDYWNNLQDTLTYTTGSIGGSAGVYVYPTDYLTINGAVDILKTKNDAKSTDTEAIDNINNNFSAGITRELEILNTSSSLYLTGNASIYRDRINKANDQDNYSTRLGAISYFNALPLDTKAVVGFDFGDSPSSLYMEGRSGYRWLKNENLYTFGGIVYQTGPETLELVAGADFEAMRDLTINADFDYISSPASKDIFLSVYATKEF